MAYSAIADSELQVNKPLTSSLMFRLRDNPEALFESEKGLLRAWVNFDGTGGVTIRDSYNVSGVIRNSAGQYTITFSTPFNNSNYLWFCNNMTMRDSSGSAYIAGAIASASTGTTYVNKTTSSFTITLFGSNGLITDDFDVQIGIAGGL